MINEKILILTPTLGNRESLQLTVDTVKNIGGSCVKHVLVTNKNKKDELARKYPDLQILVEPTTVKGIYGALNFGFNELCENYEYLGFINDDDFWLPSFSLMIEYITKNSDVDVVYGRVKFVDKNNEYIAISTSSPRYKAFNHLLSLGVPMFTQQSMLMKKTVLEKVGGFSEDFRLISDTLFWKKAIDNGFRFRYLGHVCAGYTIQAEQLSSNIELQKRETKMIVSKPKVWSYLELILYRLFNVPVYFRRYVLERRKKRIVDYFTNS